MHRRGPQPPSQPQDAGVHAAARLGFLWRRSVPFALVAYRGKPVIGLVGGIGSGKSTVAHMLRDLGCHVTDSDTLARQVLDRREVRQHLCEWWGPDVLARDGSVDRSAIAAIVFQDPVQRTRLEQLVHPLVESARMNEWSAAPATVKAFVIDAPLLVEAGLHRQCDAVVFVDAPDEVRLRRLRDARGWDDRELRRREMSQLPLDEKRRAADHVVINTGDLVQLRRQVERVFEMIVPASRR